ncbi:TonB-dependent receptor domain-containing protein [Pararobbsia silviterrae]|uniref:TonB-dependent receptor n=1 Tax=Pararobbsia silviterrae TaxID=1792498 RepID=A0A494XSN6_9BURK|nr:TonB-dependent receptor [Pararobbsia silviterrae]RKP53617.1 TonB-dependent receptor [Pararobbsia silviterrae]
MKQKILTVAVRKAVATALSLPVVIAVPAFAQSAPTTAAAPAAASDTAAANAADNAAVSTTTDGNAKLQTFEVTGSLIRQTDKTGFNAVQTVTQKDIQQSGATTLASYLESLTANSASSWNETGSFQAPGAAGIALHGMSEKYTLVLVDGQRVAPYAFGSNSTDSFFDIDTIPTNVVDHIDIVKTGGVSQYGSDAVAGVVNIVTKHDYQGLQLGGNLGAAGQGGQGTVTLNALGGFGNLTSDGFNVTVAGSVYRQSGVSLDQRSTTQNLDYTSFGGANVTPVSYLTSPTGTLLAPRNCFGTVTSSSTSLFTYGAPGSVCEAPNASAQTSLIPQVDRANIKIHADFKIDDNTTAWGDVWESYDTTQAGKGYAYAGSTNLGAGAPVAYSPTPGNPYSGFGLFTATTTDGYSPNLIFPTQSVDRTDSNFYRVSGGVKGEIDTASAGTWNWQASVGHSQSTVTNELSGQVNANLLSQYLSTVSSTTFNMAQLESIPGILGTASQLAISKLETADASISTPDLFHLPAGDVGVGFGVQFQHQSEYIGSSAANDQYLDPYIQSVDGERNIAAAYYQFDIPLLPHLTFSQSGRYDHYSDVGNAFSPRFALRYQPIQALTAYASFDRGFRAPTLIESHQTVNYTAQDIDGYIIPELTEGNSKLQPEHTKNYNIGFELSPTRNTDFGFDWYRIHVTNVIGQQDLASTVASVIASTGEPPAYVVDPLMNLGDMTTDGFEGTFRQIVPTALGAFTFNADWAWVWHYTIANGAGQSTVDLAGNNNGIDTTFGAAFPRWKGNTSVNWVAPDGKWNATLTWQFTGPYNLTTDGPGSVGSYSQFNLYASYTGIKHWTLYAGINNLFNRKPPYDSVWTYNGSFYDGSLYSDVGIYGQVGATYTF